MVEANNHPTGNAMARVANANRREFVKASTMLRVERSPDHAELQPAMLHPYEVPPEVDSRTLNDALSAANIGEMANTSPA